MQCMELARFAATAMLHYTCANLCEDIAGQKTPLLLQGHQRKSGRLQVHMQQHMSTNQQHKGEGRDQEHVLRRPTNIAARMLPHRISVETGEDVACQDTQLQLPRDHFELNK